MKILTEDQLKKLKFHAAKPLPDYENIEGMVWISEKEWDDIYDLGVEHGKTQLALELLSAAE